MSKPSESEQTFIDTFSAAAHAERKKIAGPVEMRIYALKDRFGASFQSAMRTVLDGIMGKATTDEEFADYLKFSKDKLEGPLTISAIIGYLEEEHARRATWEKTVEDRLSAR